MGTPDGFDSELKADANEPDGEIRVQPAGPRVPAQLGGLFRPVYELKAPSGTTVWSHNYNLEGWFRNADDGPRVSHAFLVRHSGVVPISTTAMRQQATHRNHLELAVPKSETKIDELSSRSDRGPLPVIDEVQVGEELVVTGTTELLDRNAVDLVGHYSGSNMTLSSVLSLGPRRFQAIMKPHATGLSPGELRIMPRHVEASDIIPAALTLRVANMTTRDDFGSRPSSAVDAASRVVAEWEHVYDSRIDALRTLVSQIKLADPVAPDPMWKKLALVAVHVALAAATAGIAEAITAGLLISSVAVREAAKVLVEGGLNAALEGIAGVAFDDPLSVVSVAGALSLEHSFEASQIAALRAEKLSHVKKVTTSLMSRAGRMESEQVGSGYRAMLEVEQLVKSVAQQAHTKQFLSSLDSWASLLSKRSLGRRTEQSGEESTELSSTVDVARITQGIPGRIYGIPAPGLHRENGLLRLELARAEVGEFRVVRAIIAGFSNDQILKAFSARPLGELNIAVVARYNEDPSHGFVIGRNESGRYYGSSNGSLLQKYASDNNVETAAKHIFETFLARDHVRPVRE